MLIKNANSQNITRDPNQRKDVANVFYDPKYTLFDYWSDEPIFPDTYGIYNIYYASNESKLPILFVGLSSELKKLRVYKFKNYQNCLKWCSGVVFSNENLKKDITSINGEKLKSGAPITQTVTRTFKLDSLFQYLQSIGLKSNKIQNEYNLKYLHLVYDFQNKPVNIFSNEVGLEYDRLTRINEKAKLEIILKGLAELKYQDSVTKEELKKYGDCINSGCLEKVELYNQLRNSIQIIDFGDIWPSLLSKIARSCDWTPDVMMILNGKFYKSNIHQGDFNFSFHPINTSFAKGISIEKKGKKFYEILEKAIKKNQNVIIQDLNKNSFIKSNTGLDENYFILKSKLNTIQSVIKSIEENYFLTLKPTSNTFEPFLYIGSIEDGNPKGFGYLLNKKKQLICSAYWDDGFPIVLYNVNIFINPEADNLNYSYQGKNKYQTKNVSLIGLQFNDSKMGTFDIYFGDFKFSPTLGKNERNGFGLYFYNSLNKDYLLYYKGQWKNGSRSGKGSLYLNSEIYDGEFHENIIVHGTHTYPDKSFYTGDFKNWQKHGMGKLVFKNGTIQEGLFEDDNFKKSLAEIEQEKIQKEQERLAMEQAILAEQNTKNQIKEAEHQSSKNIFEKVFETLTPGEQKYLDEVLESNDDPKGIVGDKCGVLYTKCKYCGKSISYNKEWSSRIQSIKVLKDEYGSALGNLFAGFGLMLTGRSQDDAISKWSSDLKEDLVKIRNGNIYFCHETKAPKFCSRKCEIEYKIYN